MPVWLVFGVQSRAKRTDPRRAVAGGDAAPEDADAAAEGAELASALEGVGRDVLGELVAAASHAARASTKAKTPARVARRRANGFLIGPDIWSPSSMTNAATRDSGDGVNESTGLLPSPVLAGSGSAGLWRSPHSQRTRRSPEAVFGCPAMVHLTSGRPPLATRAVVPARLSRRAPEGPRPRPAPPSVRDVPRARSPRVRGATRRSRR